MGRLRGVLWLLAGLVTAGLAGVVAFATISRAAPEAAGRESAAPMVQVVVADRRVAVRSALTAEDVRVRQVPVDTAPEGAVATLEDAVGKITTNDLYQGEIVLSHRLVDPDLVAADGRTALAMTEDEVLVAVPARDLLSSIAVLKPGDRVDLYFSLRFPEDRHLAGAGRGGGSERDEEQLAAFGVLENVGIAQIVGGGAAAGADRGALGGSGSSGGKAEPDALLLTLSPQDALVLKYLKDAGGLQDVALRAPGAERPYNVEPVDIDYLINRFEIPVGIDAAR